jgi:hypothetical protein
MEGAETALLDPLDTSYLRQNHRQGGLSPIYISFRNPNLRSRTARHEHLATEGNLNLAPHKSTGERAGDRAAVGERREGWGEEDGYLVTVERWRRTSKGSGSAAGERGAAARSAARRRREGRGVPGAMAMASSDLLPVRWEEGWSDLSRRRPSRAGFV